MRCQPVTVSLSCRMTCASRDICDTSPPAPPQLHSQQLSRSYNELKSQRYIFKTSREFEGTCCYVRYVCSSCMLHFFLPAGKSRMGRFIFIEYICDVFERKRFKVCYLVSTGWTQANCNSNSTSEGLLILTFFAHTAVFFEVLRAVCPAGNYGVWLRQKGTDSSGSCIPFTRRGQTSSGAAQAETHQLHSAGEPCLWLIARCGTYLTWSLNKAALCLVCVVLQRVDVEKETIELVHTKPTETHELPYRIPMDSPRYHFFNFKHSHQGQLQEALSQ